MLNIIRINLQMITGCALLTYSVLLLMKNAERRVLPIEPPSLSFEFLQNFYVHDRVSFQILFWLSQTCRRRVEIIDLFYMFF